MDGLKVQPPVQLGAEHGAEEERERAQRRQRPGSDPHSKPPSLGAKAAPANSLSILIHSENPVKALRSNFAGAKISR